MNLIPVSTIPGLPDSLLPFLRNARLFDSSCSPGARVWFAESEAPVFLKTAPRGSLKQEADMTAFLCSRGLGAQVLAYTQSDADWLVTRQIPGHDCLHKAYLAEPGKLAEILGQTLRMLHSTDPSGCPVQIRTYSTETPVLIHGDYCLPNVMLEDWRFSGFLDAGGGGIGDRHVDLYWGAWSILYNLKEHRWCSRFLDAYGREDVDLQRLRFIGSMENPG